MGYFSTYSLGNVLVGIIWKALGENEGLDGRVRRGDFMGLRDWLGEKIHRYGSTYAPKELLQRSFQTGYDPAPLIGYLEKKFLS